ncbi:uncharacterized protein ARMOST_20267 [Armillaria ostoyae]|uniref:Uncharacterized protein n=1 Tax=Armillaria ostoyae TaxID=47428 RepID=A0A284S6V9_ARMOS|nr:uncharacterized protein ARMOST_20267 [Armillaria ostoyae]
MKNFRVGKSAAIHVSRFYRTRPTFAFPLATLPMIARDLPSCGPQVLQQFRTLNRLERVILFVSRGRLFDRVLPLFSAFREDSGTYHGVQTTQTLNLTKAIIFLHHDERTNAEEDTIVNGTWLGCGGDTQTRIAVSSHSTAFHQPRLHPQRTATTSPVPVMSFDPKARQASVLPLHSTTMGSMIKRAGRW